MKSIAIKLSLSILLIFGLHWFIDTTINVKETQPRDNDYPVTISIYDSNNHKVAEETAYSDVNYLGELIDLFNDGTFEGLEFELKGWDIGRTVDSINGIVSDWDYGFFAITSETNKSCAGYDSGYHGKGNSCQVGIDGLKLEDEHEMFQFSYTQL